MNKKVKDLEESFDQLNATHEKTLEANEKLSNANIKLEKSIDQDKVKYDTLVEDHVDLKSAHIKLEKAHEKLKDDYFKLEKAHSSLMGHNKEEVKAKVTCDVGSTCDFINESFFEPIVIAQANPSYSSSTSTLPMDDGFTCDATLMVENKNLKEVEELNHALGKTYSGEDRLLRCLGSQRFSLNKEGLGYTPKKGKAAFDSHKSNFVRNKGLFCYRCKQVGHKEQQCHNKNKNKNKKNVSFGIQFDSCYMLTKGINGVKAKFIGTPKEGSKKKAIWVPKTLVANLQGPKQTWVPKKS